MSRKMISLVVVVGCVFLAAPFASGASISIGSVTATTGDSLFDLTAAGTTDWALPYCSEKAGGTTIATLDGVNGYLAETRNYYTDGTFPNFSYTDGSAGSTWGTSSSGEGGQEYTDVSHSGTINLAAGSGTIHAWLNTWCLEHTAGTFVATFADSTSVSMVMPGSGIMQDIVLNYSTDTAQSLTITVGNTGTYGNAGFAALAVSQVPEPGTLVLIGTGLMGLVCYAWRKR
jgi:hypothetical protein